MCRARLLPWICLIALVSSYGCGSSQSGSNPAAANSASPAAQDQQIISCASCTTNCITPVMEILQRRIGVARAVMTTVHAYTASQQLIDGPSKDMRRGRAGACGRSRRS